MSVTNECENWPSSRHLPGSTVNGHSGKGVEMVGLQRELEQDAKCDVTLFVACYNEEKNIIATLDNIRDTMQELFLSYEIVVVDDASRDQSVTVVREYQRLNPDAPITLIRNPRNVGLSRNFVEAAFHGHGRYFKLVCGDNVDTKESLIATFKQLGSADLIIPYHAAIQGRSRLRRFLSRNYTRLVNLLSGYRLSYYNGCGVYRRSDVMRWHSRTSGFGFQAELLVRLLDEGATYVQVPITGMERQGGSSNALKLRNWVSVFQTLVAIAFRRRS